ncbi:MAG: hypothetical protein E6J78_03410 [Deltaproteobacteria bacterium]|nr:MAG: hypothetical protein E6J78_03410 [Deltaproteobacteria bacterium]
MIALIAAAAWGALVVEDARGLRALFESAGRYSPSFSPAAIGETLRERVGVNLLAEQREWGLARKGARTLVFGAGAVGLIAPVSDARRARRAMTAWRLEATNRAAAIAGRRLLLASGRKAKALLAEMSRGKAAYALLRGPASLWMQLMPPLQSATFALEASAAGLIARGLVVPASQAALLAGAAPASCEGAPPGCLRAGIGPAGREVLAFALRQAGRPPPAENTSRFTARIDSFDLEQLSDQPSLPLAVLWSISYDAPAGQGPALAGQLDLASVAAALAELTPLDAIRGSGAAGVYAAYLLYGSLLRHAGPLTISGKPAGDAAEVELRLPISSR